MATAKIQVLSEGSMRGTSFEITKDAMTLGRSESCDICIPDSTISGHHCTLLMQASDEKPVYILRDEGSTNGTRYNGERLEPENDVQLHHGDIFQAGGIELMFDSGEDVRRPGMRGTSVISLDDTDRSEHGTVTLKNAGTRTGIKRRPPVRENKKQKLIFNILISVLAVLALTLAVLFFKTMMSAD